MPGTLPRLFCRLLRTRAHETHLPTQQFAPCAHARLPGPHAHRRRTQGVERAPGQGPASHQQRLSPAGQSGGPASAARRFTRDQRLLTPRQFQEAFRRGRRRRFGQLEVITLDNSLGLARLGLVIPKRAVRQAVRRNRIRRWVRETFRLNQHLLPSCDVVVRVHGPTVARADINGAIVQLAETIE